MFDIYVVCTSEFLPVVAFKTRAAAEKYIEKYGNTYEDGPYKIRVLLYCGDDE